MRIVPSVVRGQYTFVVYPASELADELVKDLVRYAESHGLRFTVGGHHLDIRRLMQIEDLSKDQAREFVSTWLDFIEPPAGSSWV